MPPMAPPPSPATPDRPRWKFISIDGEEENVPPNGSSKKGRSSEVKKRMTGRGQRTTATKSGPMLLPQDPIRTPKAASSTTMNSPPVSRMKPSGTSAKATSNGQTSGKNSSSEAATMSATYSAFSMPPFLLPTPREIFDSGQPIPRLLLDDSRTVYKISNPCLTNQEIPYRPPSSRASPGRQRLSSLSQLITATTPSISLHSPTSSDEGSSPSCKTSESNTPEPPPSSNTDI